MERYEIGDDPRMAALVEAAARGDEAVITRDGEVVAAVTPRALTAPSRPKPIDMAALDALRAQIPLRVPNAAALIREMRDMDDH